MSRDAPATEPLTDEMIRELRDEAGSVGDRALFLTCEVALSSGLGLERQSIADAINAARAMDDERPFVRVVP